jgi:DsbC/DsbD-like thiol-disulfide interchange protein
MAGAALQDPARIGRMRLVMSIVFATAVVSIAAALSGSPREGQPIVTVHLSAVPTASPVVGGKASLHLDVTPKPKMHVYAPGEKDAIAIAWTLDPNPAIKPGKLTYPPPQKYFFPPLKLTQLVYSKPFRITQPITLANPSSSGALTIEGTLTYQACDDDVCYVPKSVPARWELKIR